MSGDGPSHLDLRKTGPEVAGPLEDVLQRLPGAAAYAIRIPVACLPWHASIHTRIGGLHSGPVAEEPSLQFLDGDSVRDDSRRSAPGRASCQEPRPAGRVLKPSLECAAIPAIPVDDHEDTPIGREPLAVRLQLSRKLGEEVLLPPMRVNGEGDWPQYAREQMRKSGFR